MKIKILLFFSVLLLSSSFSVQKASAQWVVNDPAHMGMNLGEWGANAAQWVKQLNEMIDAAHIRENLQKIDQIQRKPLLPLHNQDQQITHLLQAQ